MKSNACCALPFPCSLRSSAGWVQVRCGTFACVAVLWWAPNANAVGSYLLNENFNAMVSETAPTGWTSVATSGSVMVRELPFTADKSVRIQKLATSGESSLSRTFSDQTGKVVFEAKVLMRETAGFRAAPYIYNSAGLAVVSVGFSNGNIVTYDVPTNQFQPVPNQNPVVISDWYMIRVVINTATNTYDLFIDGVRKLNNAAVRNSATVLGKLSFYMDGTNTGTMYVDNVKMWELGSFIGAAPTPIFDVHDYGAVGNGTTNDTAAVQNAINACTGTGGSVYLGNGTFLTGTLYLQSNMTFFIDTSANLKSSLNGADLPKQNPPTTNNQLLNCRRALLYAVGVTNLKIDGGGTIDGSGTTGFTNDGTNNVSWTNPGIKEAERPITIWTVVSDHVTIQNIYIRLSAMWTVVPMETDYLLIKNVLLNVDIDPNRDGIDLVDCHHAVVQDCTVYTDDDSFCPKTGIRRGVDDVVIKDCFSAHTGANSYKFGTATYGGFSNVLIQDCYAKNATYAAMVVMSRNGAEVNNINFSRVEFSNCGEAFFIFLGQQPGHPDGDVDKLGSLNNIHFNDIRGTTSQIVGSLITGQIYNGTTYPITNLFFTDCNITFKGGRNSVPGNPPEWNSSQYPEANMFGDLPAWGYYFRHVNGITFTRRTSMVSPGDARPEIATNDVTNLLFRTDTDGDGLPDDWEQQYFGSTTGASPDADSDGDGASNSAEFIAGTNPLDPLDRLSAINSSYDGTTFTVTFRTVPLKRYQAEYADDPAADSWAPLGGIRAANSDTLVISDTPGFAVPKRFYRLRALVD
jgi:polygalacturonase